MRAYPESVVKGEHRADGDGGDRAQSDPVGLLRRGHFGHCWHRTSVRELSHIER